MYSAVTDILPTGVRVQKTLVFPQQTHYNRPIGLFQNTQQLPIRLFLKYPNSRGKEVSI